MEIITHNNYNTRCLIQLDVTEYHWTCRQTAPLMTRCSIRDIVYTFWHSYFAYDFTL